MQTQKGDCLVHHVYALPNTLRDGPYGRLTGSRAKEAAVK